MEKSTWTPAKLLELSGGYWGACALHAGVKLEIFTRLEEKPQTAAHLSERIGCDMRSLAMLLDALCAMELLNKMVETYALTNFAAEFLSRSSPKYLGHIITHHHHLMSSWAKLDQAVLSGKPVREPSSREDDEAARESFLMGMFDLAMQLAPRIVPQIDLKGRRRLLDLGGGPGTYAIHFCQHNPQLSAVICDLPTTRKFAEKTVARFGLSERIEFVARDFNTEELPTGFDVAWLSHILHSEGPQGCAEVLKKAAASLEPGGMLLVQEFILDDPKDGPLFPALFSLNMLIGTADGQSYSQGELMAFFSGAGLTDIHRIQLQLPNGAGVIAGRKPA